MAWLTNYTKRYEVQTDPAEVSADPGYIRIPLSLLPAGFWTNCNGVGDIRVTSSDGSTVLPFTPEGFDDSGETGELYVNVGLSTSLATTVYVYTGYVSSSALAVDATNGAQDMWADLEASFPLTETGGTTALDGTANNNDAAPQGTMTSGDNVAGFDSDSAALDLDGTDDYLQISSATGFDTDTWTLSGWFKKTKTSGSYLFGVGSSFDIGDRTIRIEDLNFTDDAVRLLIYQEYSGAEARWRHGASGEFPAHNTWFHLAITLDGSDVANDPTVYINGVATSAFAELTAPSGTRTTGGDSVAIGARNDGNSPWGGPIAGFRWYDSVLSANEIATIHAMESDPGTFFTFAAEESVPASGDTGYVEYISGTSTGAGDVSWTNPGNAITSLATAATADIGDGEASTTLLVVDVDGGFDDVSGTITDFYLEIVATGEDNASRELIDHTIQLYVNGSNAGANMNSGTQWTDAGLVTRTYHWDAAAVIAAGLTPAYLQASNTGAALRFENIDTSDALMSISRVRGRAVYSAGGGGGSVSTGGFFPLL